MEGHWSEPALEQMVEISLGIVPREVESLEEIKSPAARALWPTPVARDTRRTPEQFMAMRESIGRRSVSSLAVAVQMWPTPTTADAHGGPGNSGREGGENLRTAVKTFWKGPGYPDDLPSTIAEQTPGQLNPTWVEWLMGFPLGWTDLPHWATRSSRRSRNGSAGA